ncbi:hypothetical protein [Aureivirga sp. CE67]|uniref:hypothetical protein n=1 Tax=Aureivirga sp. CE67 TaxID=1788983 RepID=UPI0018CBB432|nr:hypothetical protein [Aureivirga sp. CE67]
MKYFFRILIVILLVSCAEDDSTPLTIGEDWIETDTKIYHIDTMKVTSSTIQLDSINLDTKRLLTGSYLDEFLGIVSTKNYMQLDYSSYNDINSDSRFDSIALILKHDKYYYNDTLSIQHLNVLEVIDDIKPIEDEYYYNTNNFAVNSSPLATYSYFPEPYKNDSIHIRLNDNYGTKLFEDIRENNINDDQDFYEKYKGISVDNAASNANIIGYSTESLLRLYYTNKSEFGDEEFEKDFPLTVQNSFNNMSVDKTNTFLSGLNNVKDEILSEDAENLAFSQAGTGILTKIDVPHFERIHDIPGEGTIVKANLKLPVKARSFDDNLQLSDSLKVVIVRNDHLILQDLTSGKDEIPVYGILNQKDSEFNNVYYEFDITKFLELKLDEPFTNYYIGIFPVDFLNSIDRIVFENDPNSENQKFLLELTYALYDDE